MIVLSEKQKPVMLLNPIQANLLKYNEANEKSRKAQIISRFI